MVALSNVQKVETVVNGRGYMGPHSHVICLLGSGAYSATKSAIIGRQIPKLWQDISISICGLTSKQTCLIYV